MVRIVVLVLFRFVPVHDDVGPTTALPFGLHFDDFYQRTVTIKVKTMSTAQ